MLPRSSSRPIVIDGVGYRWLLSAAHSRLLVHRADGTGSRLEVQLRREIEGMYWLPLPDLSATPLSNPLVARLIKAALRAGWSDKTNRLFIYPVDPSQPKPK